MDELPPETPTDTATGALPDAASDVPTEADLHILLERLRSEHRTIDSEIKAAFEMGVTDMLKIKRMKKIKLAMKDKIAFLENQLTPDIIA